MSDVYWVSFESDASIRWESVIWFSADTDRMPDLVSLCNQVCGTLQYLIKHFKPQMIQNHILYEHLHFTWREIQ